MFNSKSLMMLFFFCFSLMSGCMDGGKSREMMQSAMATQPEEKKVLEFFMYTCPHCRNIEPTVNSWQAKQSVLFQQGIYIFEQIPAIFASNWGSDGKNGEAEATVFYTLKRMGLEQQFRARVFAAIQDKSLDAHDPQSISAFLSKEGVPSEEYITAMKSPEVRASVSRAEQMTRQYSIFSVPAFILFNRKIILPQDFADSNAVETALLASVKEHYLKTTGR